MLLEIYLTPEDALHRSLVGKMQRLLGGGHEAQKLHLVLEVGGGINMKLDNVWKDALTEQQL